MACWEHAFHRVWNDARYYIQSSRLPFTYDNWYVDLLTSLYRPSFLVQVVINFANHPWWLAVITTNRFVRKEILSWLSRLSDRAIFNWELKVIRDCISFALRCCVIGPEKSHHPLNQSNAKQTPIENWSPVFPALQAVELFSCWVFIGSQRCFPLFWLAVVITLVLVLRNSNETCSYCWNMLWLFLLGMMIESMAGKSASLDGLAYDATPFTFSEDNPAITYFGSLLKKCL